MKKSIKLLAAIGTLSILLTSCNLGGKSSAATSSSNNESSAPISSSEQPKPVTYTITWKNYDGKVLEIDEGVLKDALPTYDGLTPTRESDAQFTYIWTGWTPEVAKATANAEYVATYKTETNKYTVTWKNENGDVLKTEDVFYGTTPEYDGETPTKDSTVEHTYTFESWSPAVAPITGNTTYVASFKEEARKYNITWKDEDGTVLRTDEVPYGTVPTYGEDAPTKESSAQYSYIFTDWAPNVTSVTGDAEYTATYSGEIRKYTVTWTNYDGTILEVDKDVPYGDTAAFNGEDPTRPDGRNVEYTFKGWSPEIVPVTGDQTYVAEYAGKGTFLFDVIPYEMQEGYQLSDINGAPWINANISGELNKIKKPSLKDDFYTSVNYSAIKNGEDGVFEECSEDVSFAFDAIYSGDAIPDTTNGAALDYIIKNILGGSVDQLKEYFNDFDVSEYMKTKAIFASTSSIATIEKVEDGYEVGFNDGYLNGQYTVLPFSWIFDDTVSTAKSLVSLLSSTYGLGLNSADISDIRSTEYNIFYAAYNDYYSYGARTSSYTVNTIPWAALKSALEDLGLDGDTKINIKKYYVNAFNSIFNNTSSTIKKNIVLSRLAFDYRFLAGASAYKQMNSYISQLGYFFRTEAGLSDKNGVELARGMMRAGYTAIFEQAYIELMSSEEMKQEVADLIDDVLEAYIEMADNSWISFNSTKNAMKKKLEMMRYISCYPEFYKQFGKLGADGIAYQSVYDLTKLYFNAILDLKMSDVPNDSGEFTYYPSYTVNAFYSPNTNSFVILNGLAYGLLGNSIEEKYGMLAMVIGHEITHAFDSHGSQYDENGNQKDWFSFVDKREFDNRVKKVVDFYDQIALKQDFYCSGSTVDGEATADMGGMKVALLLASKIDNFNYDKFFKAYAYLWLTDTMSIDSVAGRAQDEHPFNYLRVNVVCAQFDEFVETYDIQPGDGMYIPEEQRIKVW